jgi:hypothetical protein
MTGGTEKDEGNEKKVDDDGWLTIPVNEKISMDGLTEDQMRRKHLCTIKIKDGKGTIFRDDTGN